MDTQQEAPMAPAPEVALVPKLLAKRGRSRTENRTSHSFSIGGPDRDVLAHEAAKYGQSPGNLARDFALQLIRMRQEHALLGADSSPERTLLHTQLAGLEKRMAATVTTLKDQLADMQAQNAVLMALVDAFVTTYLMHTPRVPEERRAEQSEATQQRYDKLLARVAASVQAGGQDSLAERVQAINLGV
jgi:hypothetical protein